MTPPKKGLGKGLGSKGMNLDAMIPDIDETKRPASRRTTKKTKEEPVKAGEMMVDINLVDPNRKQPRKNFNEDSLQELAESIKQHGIIQPIVVSKVDNYYQIIAGERRWRAAKLAGLMEVPVIVKDYTEEKIMEVALIENIQREDLNPVEEAKAYQNLIQKLNLKQDEVAERVSKSRATITNSLRLLKLDERVLEMLEDEKISSGHARALLGINNKEDQHALAVRIFDERLSVRETERLVKAMSKPKKVKEKQELENDFVYQEIQEELKRVLGTKVTIKRKSINSGKIEIEYYSEDDFNKIRDILKK